MAETSFTAYINQRFYSEIFDAVKVYCAYHEGDMTGMSIRGVYANDCPEMALTFEIIVSVLFQSIENTSESRYQISCRGDLGKHLDDFTILDVQAFRGKVKQDNPLSDALIPYIRREQLDAVAHQLLKHYYPSALWVNHTLNPMKLVERLGLHLDFRKLARNGSILGETIFKDSTVEIYDETLKRMTEKLVCGGTILVDPTHYLSRNTGSLNHTVIHECVHWLLHRKAYALEQLFNPKVRALRSELTVENKTTLAWVEWQAKALTPKLLMPLAVFKKKAEELRKVYHYLNAHKANRIDEMEFVIDGLASYYCVSKAAAKIRLLDIGIEDARGIYKYLDGHSIPSYVFELGTLSPTQTFSVSQKNAILQSTIDLELKARLETGNYLFVESHFCLNSSKYLKTNKFGKIELTRYARLHMEECCLIFELVVNNQKEEACFDEVLYRDANSDITFEAHFVNTSRSRKEILISKRLIELQELAMSLPASFSGTVEALIKWSELTLEQVVEKTLLSDRTLFRMRTDEGYNTSIESIVQFCIGLRLPPEISSILISHSTKRLGNSELHFMYRFLLNCCYTSTIHECNDLLETQTFKHLGKEA